MDRYKEALKNLSGIIHSRLNETLNCGFDSKTSSRDLAETLIKCGYWNINTLLDDINKLLESRKNGHDVLSRVKPHDSVELTAYNVGIIASQSLIRNYMDELKEVAKNKN